jgi:hypothetical protein
MEILVTVDCHCDEGEPSHLFCCGRELAKVKLE